MYLNLSPLWTVLLFSIQSDEIKSAEHVLFRDGQVVVVRPVTSWSEMEFNKGQPLQPEPYYSREEMRCFEERKVYYMGKCYDLLFRGPCDDGFWLVLDSTSDGLRAQCAPKLCSSDSAFWLPSNKCLPLRDKTVCPKKDNALQVDSLGYGACKCATDTVRAMASNGVCYQLYSRGFCDPGYVVSLDTQADQYPATCVPDLCNNNSTSPEDLLLPYKGSCYPEGSHEPCPEDTSLSVDVHTGKPSCQQDLNSWHIINPPPRCPLVDHSGNCRDRLTVRSESEYFLNGLQSDKAKHKSKFGISKG